MKTVYPLQTKFAGGITTNKVCGGYNYRLMQVKSISECSMEAFCNTFDPHKATIGHKELCFVCFLCGRFTQVLLYRVHTGKFVKNSRTSKRHFYGFQGLQARKNTDLHIKILFPKYFEKLV